MAAPNEENKGKVEDCVMFILPSKIQKVRLIHMKNSSRKRGFHVDDILTLRVTHIITELETREQVVRSLKKSFPSVNVEEICDNCHLLKLEWFTTCLEEGSLVEICDHHRLKDQQQGLQVLHHLEHYADQVCLLKLAKRVLPVVKEKDVEDSSYQDAKYCCQRVTPLHTPNKKYCDALELLEKHAEFLGGDHQLSRALAFRKASAALRAYPRPIRSMGDVENLYDLKGGKHCKRVIQELLEDGFSTELDNIEKDEFFQTMKELLEDGFSTEFDNIEKDEFFQTMKVFTDIFGCGSATARKWYEKGHRTLDDVQRAEGSSLSIEQRKGLDHYRDLNTPVTRDEALKIHAIVKAEAEQILPGCTVIMTGGFIRGKASGHDVDFLISHPEEGREKGLLPKLLQNLRKYLLYTDVQRNTYGEAPTLSKRQNTMDHFERCFSIFKLPTGEWLEDGDTSDSGSNRRATKDGSFEEPAVKRVKTAVDDCSTADDGSFVARRVDFVVTPASQHAFALMGWTGSRMFCRSIRDYAGKEMNMILTSHGLFDKANNCSLEAKTEREIFQHLQLPYREPHERNC